ncbi:MAG: transporter suffix domain-containing protein [Motiliproteus sp.]|nr:transporter suffix domain-containing protein [Motiliproteus sp.]
MKKKFGLLLLFVSFLPWGVILLLPFSDLSLAEIAAATTGLIIFAEVTFLLAIALMGREVWEHLKTIVKLVLKNNNLDK